MISQPLRITYWPEFPWAIIRGAFCSRKTATVSMSPTASTTTSQSSIRPQTNWCRRSTSAAPGPWTRRAAGTEPFEWNGGNADMPGECGPRTEKFFFRSQSFNRQQLTDLVTFVFSLPYRPNRSRLPNGELTPAQERGKTIFERTNYKNGKPIPDSNQCATCHSGPKYTNQRQVDVGTGKPTDRSPVIDVPQLSNVAYSAPYLHDGSA